MAELPRDRRGRYRKNVIKTLKLDKSIIFEHNYCSGTLCNESSCKKSKCVTCNNDVPAHVNKESWKVGRRLIEMKCLLESLTSCSECGLGPIPLTKFTIVGERKLGLGGYYYVRCQNPECHHVNRAPYGKVHHQKHKKHGMPCFDVNTKLGSGMYNFSASYIQLCLLLCWYV